MSPGLSLLQAPPFIIVFGFFLTAIVFGTVASFLELYFSLNVALNLPILVHLYTLGFALFSMFGALFQMLPVVAGAVIKNPKPKALLSYALLILGVPLLTFGFSKGVLLIPGALITYAGILYTSLLALFHLMKIRVYTPTPKGFRFSLIFLMLGASLGLYTVLSYGGLVPYFEKAIRIHFTLLLFGWIGLLIASVSFQVVEMFFVTEAYKRKFSMSFPLLVSAGILLSLLDGLFVLPLSFIFLSYSLMTIKRLLKRRRKNPDYTLYFWYLSMAFLMVSLLLFPFLEFAFYPFLFSQFVFFSSMIMGMMYRIVPFLVWFHLSNELVKDVPLMSDVIPSKRIRMSFYLHALWVFAVGLSFLFKLGYAVASFIHIASFLLLLYNVLMGGMLYFKLRGKSQGLFNHI